MICFSNQKGYSLIEIVIALTLIIILSAVIVPKYSSLKNSAKVVEAKYGLTKLYREQKTYYMENSHYNAGSTDVDPGEEDEFPFKFNSDVYIVGFESRAWGEKDLKKNPDKLKECTIYEYKFTAGSYNKGNKLTNFSINHKNCLKKMEKESEEYSDCTKLVGGEEECLNVQ